MKKTFKLLSALLLASSCFAQPITALTVDPVAKFIVTRGKSTTVKIHARIADGYHVNSNKPHEDYLIPLRLTVAGEPLTVETVKYPEGHDEKYSFSEKPLNVHTKEFDIIVTLKASDKLEPQMHVLLGKLRYQACSDSACLAPKTIEIRLTADVR